MKYRLLTKKEEEQTIIKILDTLLDQSLPYSGKHRKEQWEKGWNENLKSGNTKPKYFGKYPIHRLNGRFIKADKEWEMGELHHLLWNLCKRYFKKTDTIIEFGCGTGHNLQLVKHYMDVAYPDRWFIGADWTKASNKIVHGLGMEAWRFDFFKPWKLPKGCLEGCGVYTVAALEQTGTNYKKFVSHLLNTKPEVVIHIEPIPELLNPNNLLDYLSIKYMEKRKYLSGYLNYLQSLEKQGKIKILEARRSGIGSLYIDGYSIIVWKPL